MKKALALVAFFVIFSFLLLGVVQMRPFGEPENEDMDDYFLGDSQKRHEVNNVVTAVLFDYRGLDTLGEATILFAAVSGVLTVLRRFKDKEEGEK